MQSTQRSRHRHRAPMRSSARQIQHPVVSTSDSDGFIECNAFHVILSPMRLPHHMIAAVDIHGIPVDHTRYREGEKGDCRSHIGDSGKLVLRRPLGGFR